MNNYEYIVASLPILSRDPKSAAGFDSAEVIEEIRSQFSTADKELLDMLLHSRVESGMTREFYLEAGKCSSRFLREYLRFDMDVRNTKAAWLNKAFSRPASQDLIILDEESEAESVEGLDSILSGSDLLERERGLDALYWDKIEALTVFDYFDADAILGFVAKLLIVDRWLKLDEKTGRELFGKLVRDMRENAPEIKFEA
ncbi:MAG: DUF2764 family protein [Bacteroidales bacterium]|nr:DUF2764 family protein [Bacteroidales bacterium]